MVALPNLTAFARLSVYIKGGNEMYTITLADGKKLTWLDMNGTVSATKLWDGHTTDERSMQSYGNMVDIRHADYKKTEHRNQVLPPVQVHRLQWREGQRGPADRIQRCHRQRLLRAPALDDTDWFEVVS